MNGFVVFTNQSYDNISTRAPAGGTSICRCLCRKSKITTHTPVWGWTKPKHAAESYAIFQPTPPHGGWTSYHQLKGNHNLFQHTSSTWGMNGFVVFTNQSYDYISTHTPVWGWTWDPRSGRRINNNFNPHPRMGMNVTSCLHPATGTFQPTPPRGMNGGFQILQRITGNYNPHPRMGMNCGLLVILHRSNYFNPHPRMGMNILGYSDHFAETLFQPTPPYGDELMSLHRYTPEFISTHTPAMGWTSICRCLCWKSKISTHIPLRGWTNRNYRNIQFISFQPTPPHGGWTFLFGSPWKIIKDFNPHPVWG